MAPPTSSAKVTSVTGLGAYLCLSAAQTEALLGSDQVKEAFRLFRNRCLVSNEKKVADLPDWHAVDAFLFETQMSDEFLGYVGRKRRETGGGATTPSVSPSDTDFLEEHLLGVCRLKPYLLMPHVALFVWGVSGFLMSSRGARFDVVKDSETTSFAGRADHDRREVVFERYSRVMKILAFLIAKNIA
ncbi:hypothetical protein F4808DRAFT_458388 [Astrocystis sublimbata]|nr:hypothetical protein F4808DRAFT_458388 [Astrocystis sublimbata]